jgi:hypothetical protein
MTDEEEFRELWRQIWNQQTTLSQVKTLKALEHIAKWWWLESRRRLRKKEDK